MKKKTLGIVLAFALVFAMLSFLLFGIFCCDIFVNESPNGDYQIVSLWIDKGGFGYGGACYIKGKGLFSKWHKIGEIPCTCEWISETQFTVYRVDYSGIGSDKEYNVNDFFAK